MDWRGWLNSVFPRSDSISRPLLTVLLVYSFSSQFLPIEPYLVPYLTTVKDFTNFQVTNFIFPVSVYAQLIFTLIMAPASYYLSHKVMIIIGAFGLSLTYLLAWCGQSLVAMQTMQVMYGFATSSRLVFSSYIFLLVLEEDYQIMTSLTQTVSLLSFVLASELGQLLALTDSSYEIYFIISLVALIVCCASTFLLPADSSSCSLSYLNRLGNPSKGWTATLKETWGGKSLKILSVWWALAFAGVSLVQNYGTTLFDAIDSHSKFNGHILAISEAGGSLGSYCAIYIDKFSYRSRQFIYVLGSSFMGIICVLMGVYTKIWGAYLSYVVICTIYRTFSCLVSVQCGRLLSNGQFILLFSVNNFAGLLIETLLQAAVEVVGLSIYSQFIAFSGLFFVATAIFITFSCIDCRGDESNKYVLTETGPEGILTADT
ncbi:thiamine transporter 2-like isoform X1 [Zingiber officinale]|uniref:thiamine transporter 2-like isoform X1 n=2 Tax=Zingiber officinale TaxID=94328 RepID=UPI001C4B434F|nr:thiamine transporter 2-like isoform X1 [Zingiber officinale]